ncbi:Calcium-transporting ATPase 10, plasma membrane-type [Quaeritorhiza haematococci]|nr:Calcium-transporting ATPase 10, plasma membrane-type [Quaeritorhiza haematococci]
MGNPHLPPIDIGRGAPTASIQQPTRTLPLDKQPEGDNQGNWAQRTTNFTPDAYQQDVDAVDAVDADPPPPFIPALPNQPTMEINMMTRQVEEGSFVVAMPPSNSVNVPIDENATMVPLKTPSQAQISSPANKGSSARLSTASAHTGGVVGNTVGFFTLSSNVEQPTNATNKLKFQPPPLPDGGGYGITPEELAQVVNFDDRHDDHLLELLNSEKYGGLEGIAYLLRTNVETGLTTKGVMGDQKDDEPSRGRQTKKQNVVEVAKTGLVADFNERTKCYGKNVIEPPPPPNLFKMVYDRIASDTILKVLIVGAVLALVVGMIPPDNRAEGWHDSVAILVAVVLVSTVTAGNDYAKERKFKKLLLLQSAKRTKVIRNGHRDAISSWDLLVGDVVELALGDEVPADGLYIIGEELVIDESPLTGEAIPMPKDAQSPFLFSGCQVSDGKGLMLVTAVGPRSTGGQIQQVLSERQNEMTPLQKKLEQVAFFIGKIGVTAAFITFAALVIRWGVRIAEERNAGVEINWSSKTEQILKNFVLSVTILVVCVPEGLPLAVTMSLGFSMFKMMKENCFVRQLHSSETMGEATCICTDKTGTLTENRMTVVKACFGDFVLNGEGSGERDLNEFKPDSLPKALKELVCEGIAVNSTCFLKFKEGSSRPIFVGNPTEGSLLVFAQKLGVQYEDVRNRVEKVHHGTWLFDSARKKMSTLIVPSTSAPSPSPDTNCTYLLHSKGASEIMIAACTHYVNSSGTRVNHMRNDDRAGFLQILQQWASEGLRTFALAYRYCEDHPNKESSSQQSDGKINPEHDLILIGIFGIKDPVRKEVPAAVVECQKAGLVVRMVTGDNILTARKIAQECGILTPDGITIEGPKFRSMTREQKLAIMPKLQVLARSSPADKYELVTLLKETGEVVAVTGDGTNDAPALKAADIGFSMGVAGTQTAINASDIVLLDDNFVSLVAAIRWGRNVLNCVRMFLQFQLAVNFSAVVMTIISSAITGKAVLNSVQLLWINLIMDSLGALSLASEPPAQHILQQPPHPRHGSLLTPEMQTYIVLHTIYQVTALLTMLECLAPTVYVLVPGVADAVVHKHVSSIILTTFVLLQMWNQVMSRQLHHELFVLRDLHRNMIFLIVVGCIGVIQIIIVHAAEDFFDVVVLNSYEWLFCVAVATCSVPWIIFGRGVARVLTNMYRKHQKNKLIGKVAPSDIETGKVSKADLVKSSNPQIDKSHPF